MRVLRRVCVEQIVFCWDHSRQIMGWSKTAAVIIASSLISHDSDVVAAATVSPPLKRDLPQKVLIGYASHNLENVRKAVIEDGVNVVIWAFMDIVAVDEAEKIHITAPLSPRHLDKNEKLTRVRTGLDIRKIKGLIAKLDNDGHYRVVHLVSFGGWDGYHLDPSLTAQEWYSGWKSSIASDIFHGIDWDYEGNDDMKSEMNVFTVDCLEKMGEISRMMKNDGYVVTMAPPQSYLNFDDSNFSRFVNLSVPTRRWQSQFEHFGRNVYAYLLAKYGEYIDLISIQLYESYSDADMSVYYDGMEAGDYLYSFISNHVQKDSEYLVDFSQDKSLNMGAQLVQVPLSKLVIGLPNGWAVEGNRTLYIPPSECQAAYLQLKHSEHGDLTPRGFMFWTIENRGTHGVYLARDINKFLNHDI
ncbi:hypothetical protein ACHAWF_003566 [Thalassiosira exigua]